jgi:thymidylate synthase (FAD)
LDKIEVKILNPEVIQESEKMMVCCARLTQKGHNIKNIDDFVDLYNKSYTENTVKAMTSLPHPTIQKFGVINVVVVGASRRFLAQITRHQNEIKFMSASLQYSDYSGEADFTVPYELLNPELSDKKKFYLETCEAAMDDYMSLTSSGINNDTAGYAAPQGLRNILVMSATPYQWKHMISQRTCRRNTDETRYVMLKIWEQLYAENPVLFGNCGPFCMKDKCLEGKMTCANVIPKDWTPTDILNADFSYIMNNEVLPDV